MNGGKDRKDKKSTQWVEVDNLLLVAKERLPSAFSKNAQAKWQKEIQQARILSERGHKVCLVGESGRGKHYDALVDGRKTEMKTVTGNVNAIGKNFRRAMKQATDVFLRIKTQNITVHRAYSKLVGTVKAMLENGYTFTQDRVIYVWLDSEGILSKWDVDEIIQSAMLIIKEKRW